jgi:hypothetical protein
MTCKDCETIWDVNRYLNKELALSQRNEIAMTTEAHCARIWADRRSAKIIRSQRLEIEELKSRARNV